MSYWLLLSESWLYIPANVEGMANLDFLGIYDSQYIAGIYGMQNCEKLIYLEIVRSHTSVGYGTFIEYPLISSMDEYIPFYEYPPNLLFLNVSGNPEILKYVNLPSTLRAINATDSGAMTIDDFESDNDDNTFPQLKVLDLSNSSNLYSIDGVNERALWVSKIKS